MKEETVQSEEQEAHPEWFRELTKRERWGAAILFMVFGVWFVALAWVQRGWWFGWVMGALGVISFYAAARHVWKIRQ
jgi:hypothetical protein